MVCSKVEKPREARKIKLEPDLCFAQKNDRSSLATSTVGSQHGRISKLSWHHACRDLEVLEPTSCDPTVDSSEGRWISPSLAPMSLIWGQHFASRRCIWLKWKTKTWQGGGMGKPFPEQRQVERSRSVHIGALTWVNSPLPYEEGE